MRKIRLEFEQGSEHISVLLHGKRGTQLHLENRRDHLTSIDNEGNRLENRQYLVVRTKRHIHGDELQKFGKYETGAQYSSFITGGKQAELSVYADRYAAIVRLDWSLSKLGLLKVTYRVHSSEPGVYFHYADARTLWQYAVNAVSILRTGIYGLRHKGVKIDD